MNEDESRRAAALAGHKQFASGAAQGHAALIEAATQGDPGFAPRHQPRAPVEIIFFRALNR
jgi:hypothetical protein